MYRDRIEPVWDVVAAVDDRPDILTVWERVGISVRVRIPGWVDVDEETWGDLR